ncbi:MAG: hypothetical protein COA88_15740 [Kordia sp.]|nr:MAG: hypothetical protein COA88_15740 [Kordia sp.]
MIPTLTNNSYLIATVLIFLLCVSGMFLSIQLRKTKYVLRKTRMRYLSEKSAAAILREKEIIDSEEQLIAAAKYGYNYHSQTQFMLRCFEKNCLDDFLLVLRNKMLKNGV